MVSENEHDYIGNHTKSHETVMKGGSRVCVHIPRCPHTLPTPMRHCRKCLWVRRMKNKGGVRVFLMAVLHTSRPPPDLPHPSKAMQPTFWATLRDPLHTWQSLPRLRHRLPRPPMLLRRANQANVGNAGLRPVMVMEAFGWMGRMGLATSERSRSPHSSIAAFASKMAAGSREPHKPAARQRNLPGCQQHEQTRGSAR